MSGIREIRSSRRATACLLEWQAEHILKRLELVSHRGTKVTRIGVSQLRKAFPQLRIMH